MKKKQSENYLDYVPMKADQFEQQILDLSKETLADVKQGAWYQDEEGVITLLMENTGIMNRVAQKLLHKPRISQIHMEAFGSFIWKCIDGEKDIHRIGEEVKEHFGDAAEPLYERLCQYMKSLEVNGFITYKK